MAHRKFQWVGGGRFPVSQIYVRVAHQPKKTGGPSREGKRVEGGNKKLPLRTGLNLRFLLGMKVAMKTTRNNFN